MLVEDCCTHTFQLNLSVPLANSAIGLVYEMGGCCYEIMGPALEIGIMSATTYYTDCTDCTLVENPCFNWTADLTNCCDQTTTTIEGAGCTVPTNGQVINYSGTCYEVQNVQVGGEGTTFIPSFNIFDNCVNCETIAPCPSPTPTPTMTVTPTVTPTLTPTNSVTPTITDTATQTPTITETPTNTPTPTRTVTPTVTRTPTPSPGVVYNSLGLLASGFNNRTEYKAPATTIELSTICNSVRTLGGGELPGTDGHVYYTGSCATITSSATAPGKILYALTDVGFAPFYAPLEFQAVTNGCQGWLTGAGGVILSTYPSFCSGGSGSCVICGS
jgi:hypothetical protein